MADFAEGWTHLGDLGVAVMPTTGLHAHGARKGWRWATDEITDGVAATEQDIVDLGDAPVAAYLLGHVVDGDGSREQAVVVGEITHTRSGGIHWEGDLPRECVGAPVFISVRLGGRGHRFKLVRVGVAVHADGRPLRPHPRRPGRPDRPRPALGPAGRRTEAALVAASPLILTRIGNPAHPSR
ncbi:hypothetical protein J8N05_01110 [Streptomyces sp. BH-SS-21]|uniref:Uncharacterized protein n=1 Tax=Streptomyces liliiviolaceus TaxID=2823109 RepID=A0A940XX72_9ACTN|nr:hypothetical protein [Streptomyces liliiviolaceus]MBQ0846819.1 hypothetical protein [Streptomyces liliiviolaceus]